MAESLYIIDGHAQIFRAYYAPFRNLTSPAGEPTRATYVFCQMLLNLIRDRQPDRLVMVLDADESKLERRKIYPDYKAQREPPPEDLHPQEQRIIAVLRAAQVPLLQRVGHEADDIIATLVRQYAGAGHEIVLVSRDKDLEQLLGPHVMMYDPLKSEEITPESLREKKGWSPEQAIEVQILTGDTVDNVPGVPGIGPKTAAKLINKYGSAAAVVEHADELTPKQRENVKAFADRVDMVRQLVTLRDDVPIEVDLDAAVCARFDWGGVRPIFEELGFRRLLEQLPGVDADAETSSPSGEAAVAVAAGDVAGSADDFVARARQLAQPDGGEYTLINTPAQLDDLVAALQAQPAFAVDTETTGLSAIDCDLVGVCLSWEVGRGYYVPVRSALGQTLDVELVRDKLSPIFADASKTKVGQNLKYDLNVLRAAGMPLAGPLFDTMIAAFVVEPTRGSYKLDRLVEDMLSHRMIPITDLIGKRGKQQMLISEVPLEHVAEYGAEDADYTWRLRELLEPQLASAGVEKLFYELEMPLVAVLAEMEFCGIRVDCDLLVAMSKRLADRAAQIVAEVHKLVELEFNLDSPKQLAEVLFDKLEFRVVRKTKTSRSTDADTLEVLQRETQHPIFALILEYREIQKLRGTYVDALPAARSARTDRIHTSFHQTAAITGRLSSSEPNLQNIPIRTEAGREIRRAFVPRSADERLIVADYSQVELRMLAHFSEDEALAEAFRADQDIHAFVAAQVNGVALEDVTREMRGNAKAVNFGIIYGQTAFGLSQATGMSRADAQTFIDEYFARYPRIRAFIDGVIAQARRDGEVKTILGRRRPILDINSRNANVRAQAERFAVNTVIQGSAADLIKTAMIRLHARIAADALPLRMLLQVHDELVCEAPRPRADELADVVQAVMSGAMELRVPLKVDIASGANWLEAK
jgi:DNA polymerase-1